MRSSLDFDLVSWQERVGLACARPEADAERTRHLHDLAIELAEAFPAEVTIAITKFLRDLMRSWRTDEREVLAIAQRRGMLSVEEATWDRFLVEVIVFWVSDLQGDVCEMRDLEHEQLRYHIRRSLAQAIFSFFVFLLTGTDSAHNDGSPT